MVSNLTVSKIYIIYVLCQIILIFNIKYTDKNV